MRFGTVQDVKSLLEDPYFAGTVKRYSVSLRRIAGLAAEGAVPVPVFAASLSYLDTYAAKLLDTGIVELRGIIFRIPDLKKKTRRKSAIMRTGKMCAMRSIVGKSQNNYYSSVFSCI